MRKLIVSLIVLAVCSTPALALVSWEGAGGGYAGDGSSWSDGGNWDTGVAPVAADDVVVNAPGTTITASYIGDNDGFFENLDLQAGTISAVGLYGGHNSTNNMVINGGTLISGSWSQIARVSDATLTINTGLVDMGWIFWIGEIGYGTLNMNGGILQVDGTFEVKSGEINYAGGTIIINSTTDYTGLINEAYWHGAASASFDGSTTTIIP